MRAKRAAGAARSEAAGLGGAPTLVTATGAAIGFASATATVLTFDPGIYAVEIAALPPPTFESRDLLPPIRLSRLPSAEGEPVELIGPAGVAEHWLDHRGGLVVVRSAALGSRLMVTVFGPSGREPGPAQVTVRRLDHLGPPETSAASEQRVAAPARFEEVAAMPPREVAMEVLVHIERRGDCLFSGPDWIGDRARRLRIEGFGLRPLEGISPRDIQYRGLLAGDTETAWAAGPDFCGTRGRSLPLIGFAIRLAPQIRDRFTAIYDGAFSGDGTTVRGHDGELCRSARPDAPLTAMKIRIVERGGGR